MPDSPSAESIASVPCGRPERLLPDIVLVRPNGVKGSQGTYGRAGAQYLFNLSSPMKKEILRFAQNDLGAISVMLSVSEASRRSRVVREGLFQPAVIDHCVSNGKLPTPLAAAESPYGDGRRRDACATRSLTLILSRREVCV